MRGPHRVAETRNAKALGRDCCALVLGSHNSRDIAGDRQQTLKQRLYRVAPKKRGHSVI